MFHQEFSKVSPIRDIRQMVVCGCKLKRLSIADTEPTLLPILPILIFAAELTLSLLFGMHMMGDTMMHRLGELSICILLWLVAVRIAALLISFGFAFRNATIPQRQTTTAWIATFFREFFATLLAFTFLIPFRFFFAPYRNENQTAPETVVLLVHGLLSNSGVWWLFSRRLKKALVGQFSCLSIDSIDLGAPFASIDSYVKVLDLRIKKIRQNKNVEIILIGHSMGGLVCRAWLGVNEGVDIKRLITIGTPHQGSQCANILGAANLKQMRPASLWLQKLPATPTIKTIAIYSVHDNLVVPFTSGFSKDFDSVQLTGTGHLGLLFDRKVIASVKGLLRNSN
jgi:triacylglycerol lipase